MIPSARRRYNELFSEEKYKHFIEDLNGAYDFTIKFRVAETPIFVPADFRHKLVQASDEIIDFLVRDDFKNLTEKAIPPQYFVPGESANTHFLALDYAIVRDSDGQLIPQLIELQGFPSLFAFQDLLANTFRNHFDISHSQFNHFGMTSAEYRDQLKKFLLGKHSPENVILLEIDPLEQNTAIDFVITEKITGIRPVHLGDIKRDGRKLSYRRDGQWTPIHRIYNRVIFDELARRNDLQLQYHLTEEVDVEWAGHPNFFYRISKYTMPFLESRFVPECRFLNEFDPIPSDLENYVLKPLFSFSGSGIVFHTVQKHIDDIPVSERGNFLLQRKVKYEPVIQAPDGMVKAEIRMLYWWEDGQTRPRLVTNLARLSRGEMIGVKFNKDKTWVGGTVCFFD